MNVYQLGYNLPIIIHLLCMTTSGSLCILANYSFRAIVSRSITKSGTLYFGPLQEHGHHMLVDDNTRATGVAADKSVWNSVVTEARTLCV